MRHPVVVSKDKYVVDGHHRWAAMKKAAPEKGIPVLMINAPINDALGVAVAAGTKREKF
jgi:ParB-like chromosome segregation protein Spo0J